MSVTNSPQGGLTRRGFLKTTAAVAGATALAGGATLAAIADEGMSAAPDEKVVPARCTWSGCQNCQQNVTVRDGHVVKIDSVPDEPWGNRVCLRGRGQVQRVNNPNRIKYPMKRATWSADNPQTELRGLGEWERVTWDEAIKSITDKWKEIIAEYGSTSIAAYSAVGNAGWLSTGLGGRLLNVMQFTRFDSSVDLASMMGMQKVFGGYGYYQPASEDPDDIFYSKNVINWGQNTTECYIQQFRKFLDAMETGINVVTVSPIRSTMANASSKWIPIRPAADAILMSAMVKYIIDEKLYDEQFLLEHSNAPFLVKKESVSQLYMSELGVAPLEGPPNPYTGQPTIIDPGVMWDLEAGGPVSDGTAASPALSGSWVVNGVECVTALDMLYDALRDYTPEYASEICGVSPDDIRYLARVAVDGPVKHVMGMGTQSYNNAISQAHLIGILMILGGQIGKPGMGVMQGAWFEHIYTGPAYSNPTGTSAGSVPILKLVDIMNEGQYNGAPFTIKSILSYSANYVNSCVDAGAIKQALRKVDLMVTSDIAWTDTALYSDFVLPASCSYENEDIQANPLFRMLLHTSKCVDAPYECKSDADIIRLLAEGLGVGDLFRPSDEEFLKLILDNPPYAGTGITLERLRKEREWWPGDPEQGFIINSSSLTFSTASGKPQVFCDSPMPRVYFGQAYDPVFEKLPNWKFPTEAWSDHEIMKKYPIILQSERARWRLQTCGWDVPWFQEIEQEPRIRLSVEDAAERGIETGDYVEVFNDRGSVIARATISACHPKGVSVYPKGLQSSQFIGGESFSVLSSRVFDPIAVNSSFFDTAVEIRKWDGVSK